MGGYLYDRGVDGSECRWARVLAYEPPNRVLLSWNISPQWQIETDLDKTSEWEVRFHAETAERTRVEIEHRHLERHGDRTPVKITITVAPELNPALQAYAELYREAYGEQEPVAELIPYMLESFLTADRGFAKARKDRRPDASSQTATVVRLPARRRTTEPIEPTSSAS